MNKNFFCIITFLVFALAATAQSMPKNLKKLLNAQYAISAFYVDSINEDKVVEDAIKGILNELDPHSAYSTADETKELNEPLAGKFSGIGIQFNMTQDTLYVIQTIAGGPSERVGLLPGDRIIAVNDTVIAGKKMKTNDIMKRLRGPKGTNVNVTVKRGKTPQPIEFRITRDDIPLYSIDASYMLDKNTGYIKVARFAESTNDEFVAAIDSLRKVGLKQLIIDLASNGGGLLNSAIEMSNELLSRGDLIVYTEGRTSPRNEAKALGNGKFKKGKVVIIVDQNSASAAEILSGAVQDNDRGVIVGRRTFGKGLVQRPFVFEDGSMMRLTVARYHTPSGRCIQKPYTKGDKESYDMDLINRYNQGELYSADSIHFADSLRYSTIKNKRTIYGGGGIMPDIFVPLDTTQYSNYHRDLIAKGIMTQYCIDYVDKNRNLILSQYTTLADFDNRYEVSDQMMQDIIDAASRDSIKFREDEYNRSKEVLRTITKALIARDVFTDQSAYFVVINHINDLLKQALDIINDDRRYEDILKGNK